MTLTFLKEMEINIIIVILRFVKRLEDAACKFKLMKLIYFSYNCQLLSSLHQSTIRTSKSLAETSELVVSSKLRFTELIKRLHIVFYNDSLHANRPYQFNLQLETLKSKIVDEQYGCLLVVVKRELLYINLQLVIEVIEHDLHLTLLGCYHYGRTKIIRQISCSNTVTLLYIKKNII